MALGHPESIAPNRYLISSLDIAQICWETGKEYRKRNRKVAVLSCPSIPMNAGREQRRGGTVGHVWSSQGAQQGVACCTHAGPWLDSNLFVTLPVGLLIGL